MICIRSLYFDEVRTYRDVVSKIFRVHFGTSKLSLVVYFHMPMRKVPEPFSIPISDWNWTKIDASGLLAPTVRTDSSNDLEWFSPKHERALVSEKFIMLSMEWRLDGALFSPGS